MINKPKFILVHCSDVKQDTIFDQLKSINEYHRDVRQFPISSLDYYVGYQYLITGGRIYQCRLDTDIGAHCNFQFENLSMNFQSIGVCWGGDGDEELPNITHQNLLKSLIGDLMKKYDITLDRVVFHRDFDNKGKTCPGKLFTKEYLLGIIKSAENPITEKCNDEKKIIEIQKGQISNLQLFISNLIKLFTNK